ncbi:putative Glyceraldehyde-3-phosphate dehydrogenase [Desulfovibrio sp. DV]|uniref:aldehyde dehydrogenase family protein n=1 Tax=Desulfovibrio sp. DV TaxID=1844708 RepID=UPI00094B83BF|nr:aldehyde dehydrogenase family protein [Desulfovibrio sp. DV]OLN27834.1 putative Glyceraldehyde-3-phosphate dehydrogenase [Desulfovibrio sp. DV]
MSQPRLPQGFSPDAGDVPAACALSPLEEGRYLIGGELLSWPGPMQTVTSPIYVGNEQAVLGSCPDLTGAESLAAVDAVSAAWDDGRGEWPTMSVARRIGHVEAFARRMVAVRDTVVRLMAWEICKPLPDCRAEFDRTVDYMLATVEALKDLDRASSRFVIESGIYAQIRRAPLGPVLCMGPYNYPLNETFTTLIPALIMGNPVIVKTPRIGKLLYAPLLEAFADSFPPGVINILFGGRQVAIPALASGKISVLAFIGSSQAADALRRHHPAPHRLRCVLGLDAKNVGIVLPCADMELTATEAVAGALTFSGQRCTALKLFYVHESRLEEFLARTGERIAALPMGLPWQENVRITPLPVPGKPEALSAMVAEAVAQGARVANPLGGTTERTLVYPALVAGVAPGMRLHDEEQFGPVVPVASFAETATAARAVTASPYGQQMSIFGTDPEAVAALIDPMVNQVCRVNINCQCQRGPDTFPFTGRKDSAEGTLSVSDALRAFSIRTLVAAKGSSQNKELLTNIVKFRRSNFLSTDFLF